MRPDSVPNRSKRGKLLSLSLTNNIDVLREKLYMEIARRNRLRNQNQVGRSAMHFAKGDSRPCTVLWPSASLMRMPLSRAINHMNGSRQPQSKACRTSMSPEMKSPSFSHSTLADDGRPQQPHQQRQEKIE